MPQITNNNQPEQISTAINYGQMQISGDRSLHLRVYWPLMALMVLLLSLLSTTPTRAQSKQKLATPSTATSSAPVPVPVQGTITDIQGIPIAGVRVITIPYFSAIYSDVKGNFKIAVSNSTKKIEFSKTGYERQTIQLTGLNAPLHIQLRRLPLSDSVVLTNKPGQNNQPLQETVIVGYGQQKRHAITGSQQINIRGIKAIGGTGNYKNSIAFSGNTAGIMGNFNNGYYNNNTESYAHEQENGFKAAASTPLSTFSIDVDKASYSNLRRFISEGLLPPVNAVRVEELINYFDYHYAQPKGNDPVNIHTELSTAPWNQQHYLLQIGLQAKKVATDALPPTNLVLLIDVSGSMSSSNKLPLLVSAFKMLTDQLRPQDYVSIVTYAGEARNVLEPTSGSDKNTIKAALDQLYASGSTNGAGGLEKAYTLAENHFRKGGNNRIILASDGDFNVGTSSLADLEDLITAKRKSGIFLSVLGVGMGNYKDDKLELLADKGNGNYAYIDNMTEAHRVLLKEFGGTLFTIAKDVKVQVEFNPAIVKAYRLIGYENRALADADFNRDSVDAGEMGSGSTVTALYEIIPQGIKDAFTPSIDSLRYTFTQLTKTDGGLHRQELGQVKIRYKDPSGTKSKLIRELIADKRTVLTNTSTDFQLAAAAAGWGMLLKKSAYLQEMTFDKVADLIQKPLAADKTGQIGGFLNLVQTSQALVGNEVKESGHPTTPPIFYPRPRPRILPKRKTPPVAKIIPIGSQITTKKAGSITERP